MVSTRTPKSRYIEKGEKVLCYEPDPKKAKVLYNSKILGVYEDKKDKRGRKIVQYKVHFQGWSSSWDRKVNADFVLKDTEENRQLQRNLAEKAQLQQGAYLYRKESSGSSRKRSRKSTTSTAPDDLSGIGSGSNVLPCAIMTNDSSSPKLRGRVSSEDNSSSGSNTLDKHEDTSMKDECETDSYCSSVESLPDEERVMLRISERLRQYLEYDHDMIVKYAKQHALPSRVPVVTILENFVKQSAVKLVFSTTQTESTRRRSTQQRTDKKEREFDKLVATVGLLKEVADGLRIYFDFTIVDHLLYKEEKEYALAYLSEENLKNFSYVASPGLSTDFLHPKCDIEQSLATAGADSNYEAPLSAVTEITGASGEEPQKRKLRSHRSDDCDLMLENCLSSIASTSSGASTPLHPNMGFGANGVNYLKSLQPMNIPPQIKDFLQTVLLWRLLPTNAVPAPSMIFGAPHLARLIVKLPEFLNASTMNDDKLKILLQHLDTFVNFLEARKEWFNEENYARRPSASTEQANPNNAETAVLEQQQPALELAGTTEAVVATTSPTASVASTAT